MALWAAGAGEAFSGTGPVIVNASCTFLLPLVYPGDIEVRMYLGEPGRTSIGSYYELAMNERKHADGAAKIVWIDLASGRSVPLPEVARSRLAMTRCACVERRTGMSRHDD